MNTRQTLLSKQPKVIEFKALNLNLEAREITGDEAREISAQCRVENQTGETDFDEALYQNLSIVSAIYEQGSDQPLFTAVDAAAVGQMPQSIYQPLLSNTRKANSLDVDAEKNDSGETDAAKPSVDLDLS